MELNLEGSIITRDTYEYETARTMWNRAIQKYPRVISYCKTPEDVRTCILWARSQEIPIRIRSGRHHYEGYSTGNEVCVIDVSEMDGIKLDEEKGEVTIEGGVRNRELYEALGAKGYAFPGGGCPTVGVVGFALGGGWGYSGRLLGLACDAIVQVELINYKGELVVANAYQNTDLLWALKGSGGGQFGVVVSLTFKLPAKRNMATLMRLELSQVTRQTQMQVFRLWQDTIDKLCPEANFKLSFYNSKEKGIGILLIGVYYGAQEEAHHILEPFIRLGHTMQVLVQPMSVLEVNRWIQNAHPDYEHYKSTGRFVEQKLNEQEMEQLLNTVEERAEGSVYTALSCYGMGGNMVKVSQETAAFAYRMSHYIIGFQTVWEDNRYSEVNRAWFVERFKEIESRTQGSFVNFPGAEIRDYATAYYKDNKNKLIEIRKQYDPEGIFQFEQGL